MYCPYCGTANSDNAVQCVQCAHNFQAGTINPALPADVPGASIVPPVPATPEQSYTMETATANQLLPNPQPAWQEQPKIVQAPPPQWAPQTSSPQPYEPRPPGQGNNAFSALIPYKNSSALIAYYLAVFALIPCFGLILGSLAFILGLNGLKFAKQHPEAKGVTHAWVGIILGGLCALANILVPIMLARSSH